MSRARLPIPPQGPLAIPRLDEGSLESRRTIPTVDDGSITAARCAGLRLQVDGVRIAQCTGSSKSSCRSRAGHLRHRDGHAAAEKRRERANFNDRTIGSAWWPAKGPATTPYREPGSGARARCGTLRAAASAGSSLPGESRGLPVSLHRSSPIERSRPPQSRFSVAALDRTRQSAYVTAIDIQAGLIGPARRYRHRAS